MSEIEEFRGMSGDYNEYLKNMPQMAPTTEQIVNSLLAYMGGDFYGRKLKLGDIGCGPGASTRYYMARFLESGLNFDGVVGVEKREDAVSEAKHSENFGVDVDFLQGDITSMPQVADDSLDVCISERVIQHLDDENARNAVAEMVRITRDGGIICLGGDINFDNIHFSPQSTLDNSILDAYQHLVVGFRRSGESEHLLADAGVTEVEVQYFNKDANKKTVIPSLKIANMILKIDWLKDKLLTEGIPYVDPETKEEKVYKPAKEEVENWWNKLVEADEAGRFSMEIPFYVTIGRVKK